jgi:starch phosphorylase
MGVREQLSMQGSGVRAFHRDDRDTRSANDQTPVAAGIARDIGTTLVQVVGKHPGNASLHDWFQAVAYFARARMADRWLDSKAIQHQKDVKTVYYLSMEFLVGRSLRNHLYNLELDDACRAALRTFGVDLDEVYEEESDAALGNGGLGRLAACFMDSLTTLGYPAYGYGIRYDAGMFQQAIEDGWQIERPDNWLMQGNPWEFRRPSITYRIPFGGHLTHEGADGSVVTWHPGEEIAALAHDVQVSGYRQDLVNTIRLWTAKSLEELDFQHFNRGDHAEALKHKNAAEALSRVLYPDDTSDAGRALRLRQEYFFVCASLQDILGRFLETHVSFDRLPDKVAIQLNDTHPALAIPEMMRLLIDQHGLDWDSAWSITTRVFSYTNHTLLPEALECWPVGLLEHFLPRHVDIIYRINDRFLKSIGPMCQGDHDLTRRVSLIEENGMRRVRMANLAFVGSHRVNGVSKLHTEIMQKETFADFERLFPGRIVDKTNGITMRRWLPQSNPRLAKLIDSRIGKAWREDATQLSNLARLSNDASAQSDIQAIKSANKADLVVWLKSRTGIVVNPDALFDVHIKRFHEYKRQLLNILQVIARYNRLRRGEIQNPVPRVAIFAGKAAASYHTAKRVIKLINDCAKVINSDPAVDGLLKVVFVPNYGVSIAERIIPAADISEQISTAGTEASGTGNMKLALNGALTIGTLDGANLEIGDAVGDDNVFFFGLSAGEVAERRRHGHDPRGYCEANEQLREVLDMVRNGYFSPDDPHRFSGVIDGMLNGGDYFMVLADFAAYVACQDRVDQVYRDSKEWARRAIVNVAGMPPFSSDRTIREYADDIWGLSRICPVPNPNRAA